MLSIIVTLSFVLFGSLFPLFLWITGSGKVGPQFHRLTLGLASFTGGAGVVSFWLMDVDFHVKLSAVVWLVSLLAITWFYWGRERIRPWVVSLPSFLGIVVYLQMLETLIISYSVLQSTSLLGGLVLCGSIFSMILGHRYLNVVNLPIDLLKRSVGWLTILLTLRAMWNIPYLFLGEIDSNGQLISILEFVQSFTGFFLGVALFFGVIVPLVMCLFILRTVAIGSTQSATGLLYVLVILVVMGDLLFKYYALQFGVFF